MAETAAGVVDHFPAEAGVHDDADPFYRKRRLGDGRGQDHLPLPGEARSDGARLLVIGQKAVQGVYLRLPELTFQPFGATADFRFSREEGQYVAFTFAMCLEDGPAHEVGDVERVGFFLRPDHLDREHFPFAFQHGCAQRFGQSLRVDRRRHDDKAEVVPKEHPALPRHGKSLIGVEAPLVKFIENHRSNAFKGRIIEQHPRQDAFRHDLYPRLLGHLAFEADPVADRFSDILFKEPCHPGRDLPCGDTSGLQHDDFPRPFRKAF